MPKFSANLGFLWSSLPLLERIDHAAQAGFRAIEMHWPYDTDPAAVKAACERHGLALLGINTPLGDAAAGESGLAALTGREQEFRAGFEQTLAWALASGATAIHVMPGIVPASLRESAIRTMVNNLQWASDCVRPHGLTLLLEAINQRDKPGYFYARLEQSNAVREAAGRDNIKLMFDVYHVGVAEGDAITKLAHYLPHIGHIQIAAVPSRAEPDEGEIRYEVIFKEIDRLGYTGWVGCEYKPRSSVEEGLGWVSAMGLSL